MINLELYRIFTIVSNEENLTRASNILHISQPAVTKHIKNLENELNVKLFKRSKYGMILTDNGKKLYLQIKDSINILNKAELLFNESRDINLGSHINMLSRLFNKAISKYYKEISNSTINVTNDSFDNMLSMLERQKLDLVLSKKFSEDSYNPKLIKFIKLGSLHDVFIVRADSKYKEKVFSKEDLKKETIYTSSTEIPVMPIDFYSSSIGKVKLFDIDFYNTKSSNSNKLWKGIRQFVSSASHIAMYIAAALLLTMLIWRSILFVRSALGDNPQGAFESRQIMDNFIKAVLIIRMCVFCNDNNDVFV